MRTGTLTLPLWPLTRALMAAARLPVMNAVGRVARPFSVQSIVPSSPTSSATLSR